MKYFYILLLLLICNAVNAATTNLLFSKYRAIHVTSDSDTVFRKRSISVGINYGSDVQFFGRTGPIKYPYMSGDAIYNFKAGFFVYGSAVQVFGYSPVVDELDLGTGYLYNYSRALSGSISYIRFIFSENAAPVIKSASSNDINFRNSFDWKLAKTSVIFDYLFGDANDYFLTINTSKFIETDWNIFDDKDYFTFNPTISVILGTQNFVGKYSEEHLERFGGYPYIPGLSIPPPFARYNNGRFNTLNYSFKLPVAYNRPHYTFEVSTKYSVPVNVEGALKNHPEVFLNLTFYYLFF